MKEKMLVSKEGERTRIVDVDLGEGVKIADFVNLYGCSIDDGTRIGAFVEIQRGVRIGKNCKIESHTFICEGVSIGDGVFIGHNVSFINDKYPKAVDNEGNIISGYEGWELMETNVGDNASVGTGSTIMGGIRIGKSVVVGAGSTVLRDLEDGVVVAGCPAKEIKDE